MQQPCCYRRAPLRNCASQRRALAFPPPAVIARPANATFDRTLNTLIGRRHQEAIEQLPRRHAFLSRFADKRVKLLGCHFDLQRFHARQNRRSMIWALGIWALGRFLGIHAAGSRKGRLDWFLGQFPSCHKEGLDILGCGEAESVSNWSA